MAEAVVFRETQRMRQVWIWLLLGVIGVSGLAAGSGAGLVVAVPVAALFYAIRLTTEVREDGVYVRFAPFHRSFRRIPFDEIEEAEATEFGLLTYGGIGIRWTLNTVAYMTDRGSGVKLHRNAAKSVVVGSQRTDELLAAIDARSE
ncbi:DUF6141 family protein [Halobacteria archaeon AArc-m2/3/4]|uniref:DUF6141 family protein n=1 Tax=Natronoglomus mannanivorans TaxID=2979990 RepID=A0AAP3E0M7_9EURY|nr:DUF6141 family protein [Halobacteria archaeon AArc-xg1-1]MCU4972796.1 DUF6141 family protein [Halobacteria archaeon AArc-m2/3/4]